MNGLRVLGNTALLLSLSLAGCASPTDEPDGNASDDVVAATCKLTVAGIATPLQRGSDGNVYFTPSTLAVRRVAIASPFVSATETVKGATSSPYADRFVITTDAAPTAAESVETIAAAVHRTMPGASVRPLPLVVAGSELRLNVLGGEETKTSALAVADGGLRFVTRTQNATASAISRGLGFQGITATLGAAPGCGASGAKLEATGARLAMPTSWLKTNEGEVPTQAFHAVLNARSIPARLDGRTYPRADYDAMMKVIETNAPQLFPYASYDPSWSTARIHGIASPMTEAVLRYARAVYAASGVPVPADLVGHLGDLLTPSAPHRDELVSDETTIASVYEGAKNLATFALKENPKPFD